MFKDLLSKNKRLAVIGLGYVGLPLALEFAKYFSVIGFDINDDRINMMKNGIDPSCEIDPKAFENKDILFTTDVNDLHYAHFFLVAVPTDIDVHQVPDLSPLIKAAKTVGAVIKKDDYVVFESTVYPGCTEEDCIPVIKKAIQNREVLTTNQSTPNDLKPEIDFKYGYSPERIVPGDKVRPLPSILKIVSGCDEVALEEIAQVYGQIITAGTPLGLMGGLQPELATNTPSNDGERAGVTRTETLYIEVRQDNVPQDPTLWFRTDKDG